MADKEKKIHENVEDVETQQEKSKTQAEENIGAEETKPDVQSPEQPKEDSEEEESAAADSKDTSDSEETTPEEESAEAKYMRLMADFRNFKKRAEKEKLDIYAYANEKIVIGLLDVLDNFERALEHESADPAYAEGMKMIFKQLMGVLKESGLKEIKTQGESFDPNFHNAVMTEDNPEFESGKVTEVLQKGYSLNNKVIRPSMVKVNN